MVDRLSNRVRQHHAPQTKTGGGLRSRDVSIAYIIIQYTHVWKAECKSSFLVGIVVRVLNIKYYFRLKK